MKLEIICTDGSPLGVSSKSIWGDKWFIGTGGAELSLLTMCETWHQLGHQICLYNDPKEPNASLFEQRLKKDFDPNADRDILIIFRTPNTKAIDAKGLKVWWSCDQNTMGKYAEFAPFMDKIVVISPFQPKYFSDFFRIRNTIVIDLPVRLDDYQNKQVSKIPGRMIFTSVPDRGLDQLRNIWEIVHSTIPETSLVLTSDYRLWGVPYPNDGLHRSKWAKFIGSGVSYLGAINRAKLIEEQLKAQLFVYPCVYQELLCIACSEAQVAGAYPVTSEEGALITTNMGITIPGNARDKKSQENMANEVIHLLNNPDILKAEQDNIQELSIMRFDPLNIADQWDKLIFSKG